MRVEVAGVGPDLEDPVIVFVVEWYVHHGKVSGMVQHHGGKGGKKKGGGGGGRGHAGVGQTVKEWCALSYRAGDKICCSESGIRRLWCHKLNRRTINRMEGTN